MRTLIVLLAVLLRFVDVRADTYPKNVRVDVINYRFALELQDRDNRIAGTAEIELGFRGEGETTLRFDLTNRDSSTGRGMMVSAVSADGASLARLFIGTLFLRETCQRAVQQRQRRHGAASAIFYSEGSVTGDRSVRWRIVIHEIAHQWFGNAVTESDWDDVWLSEGFATYFTLLYIEHAYGRDEFLADSRQAASAFSSSTGSAPTTASYTTTSATCHR